MYYEARRRALANKVSRFKIVALAWKGKNFLGMATNIPSTNYEPQAHAEVRLGKKIDLRGTTVEVLRFASNKTMTMAKPCPNCELFLRAAGVKVVRYSNWDGEMETMTL